MDISTEQIALALFISSEVLALLPENIVKSNGFIHSIVHLIKNCNDVFSKNSKNNKKDE